MHATEREEPSIEEFVKKQISKWEKLYAEKNKKVAIPVITLCMEPGSGGCHIAQKTAQRLGFDFFHRDIIHKIAESARISTTVVESLEKERLSGVQDFISSLVKDQYIHPGIYLEHLMRVIGTIGKHGHAVVVGRGANFIIPPKDRFAVRVIAPEEVRIGNVARQYGVPSDAAKRRVTVRDNRRRAFVRQSFNADIDDSIHYDMIVNTGRLSVEAAVEAIIGAVMGRMGQEAKASA
jgi:cytidylate kinase